MPPIPIEIQARYANLDDAEFEALTPKQNQALKNTLETHLFTNYGIWLDANKKAPMSNYYIPRIFVLGKDEKGQDFPRDVNSLRGTEQELGSPGFFEQVMLGNVFVYPAGQKDPVQLQVFVNRSTQAPMLKATDPVAPEEMPAAPVKRPRFYRWKRFWNRFTGGRAYKEIKEYEDAPRRHQALQNKLRDNAEGRSKILQTELKDLEKEKNRRIFEKDLQSAEREYKMDEVGKQHLLSIYQPVPDKRRNMTKRNAGFPGGARYGYALEEDFRELTFMTDDEAGVKQQLEQKDNELQQLDLKAAEQCGNHPDPITLHPDRLAGGKQYKFRPFNMKKITIGGSPLNNELFSAVALAASLQTKYIYESNKKFGNDADPTLANALQECGYSEEDSKTISSINQRNIGTTDLFMDPPRDHEGKVIKDVIDPARRETADAFEAYSKNDKKPLAKLIAQGVNIFAQEHSSYDNKFSSQTRASMFAAGELIGLMKKDPDMRELAEKEGMDPKTLNNLEGMLKIFDIDKKAKLGEYELAKARMKTHELNREVLTKEQKAEYAKHCIMHKLLAIQLKQARKDIEKDENSPLNAFQRNERFADDPTEIDPTSKKKVPIPKSRWTECPPPKGKVYIGSYSSVQAGLQALYDPLPMIADQMNDPQGYEKLEQLAEKIVQQEGLAEMSADDLFKQINHENPKLNFAQCLERANGLQPGPVQHQNQPQVHPNLHLNQPQQQNAPVAPQGLGLRG